VDIAGQQVLLGVAPGRVTHLTSFDQPVITEATSSNDFSSKIKQLMQATNNNKVVR
jgi:flagellar protein FliO/FliZ